MTRIAGFMFLTLDPLILHLSLLRSALDLPSNADAERLPPGVGGFRSGWTGAIMSLFICVFFVCFVNRV